MRGNLPANEPKMQEKWNAMDINKLQMERTEDAQNLFYMMALHMPMVISTSAML